MIDYDLLGNPIRVQFCNGNVTEYIYSADGTRLLNSPYLNLG